MVVKGEANPFLCLVVLAGSIVSWLWSGHWVGLHSCLRQNVLEGAVVWGCIAMTRPCQLYDSSNIITSRR